MWWKVYPSHTASRQFAPNSLSGKICFCVKFIFRLCNTKQWSDHLHSNTQSSFMYGLERMQPKYSRGLQGWLYFKVIVREWYKAFKKRRMNIANESRSGRSTIARIHRVHTVLRSNHLLSIQQIADTLRMSIFAVHGIVTENLQCARSVQSLC